MICRSIVSNLAKVLAAYGLLIGWAPAATAANLPGGTITVTNVLLEDHRVFMQGQGFSNPEGCQNASILILATAPELRDRYLAIAMTAMTSGLKIDLWVQGCTATNWGTAAVVYYMNMHR